jgi:hypothetical protein
MLVNNGYWSTVAAYETWTFLSLYTVVVLWG